MKDGQQKFRRYLIATIVSVAVVFLAVSSFPAREVLVEFGLAGPIGAFFAGTLFVSSFTVVLGGFLIAALADVMPLWQLVFIAGAGSALVDIVLFYFVRHTVLEEMKPLMKKWRRSHFMKILHSKYFSWTVPVLGALLIISPLPDEIGVSMMGISNMDTKRFAILSFVLNCFGVFLVATAARAL